MEKNLQKTKPLQNLRYILSSIHHHEKGVLICTILQSVINAINAFIIPYLLKLIIDIITTVRLNTMNDLNPIFLKIGLICLGKIIIEIVTDFLSLRILNVKMISLRNKVKIEENEKILSLDYETLENPDIQDKINKANMALNNAWQGYEGMYNYLKNILQNIISSLIAFAVIFKVHFSIVIVVLGIVLIKYLLRDYTNKINKRKFWDVIPIYRRKNSYVNNISQNFDISKDLRLYNMKTFIEKNQKEVQKNINDLLIQKEKRLVRLLTVLNILSILQEGFLYAILIYQVLHRKITIGNFTFMLSSVRTLSFQLSFLFGNLASLNNCSREVDDLRWLLEYQDQLATKQTQMLSDDFTFESLEFKGVYFKYLNATDYTIKDVSFTLSKNEKVALVGYNGAGKTTLIKLLMGLYHPTKGEILLNGQNIEVLNRDSYLKRIAPIFQDVNMFSFKLAENVAMDFAEDLNETKVEDALRVAGLYDKVMSFPEKLQTPLLKNLYENGVDLSGGEKQKLAIARLIYKQKDIAIFDEPTSALDALAESKLYQEFNEIVKNTSAIFISHRLASTYFCDKVFFLKEGQIIEQGTHQELMALQKEYYQLFLLQAKYYQKEEIEDEK